MGTDRAQKIRHHGTGAPICPYCGTEYTYPGGAWALLVATMREDCLMSVSCRSCLKTFEIEADVEVTYDTEKLDPDDSAH